VIDPLTFAELRFGNIARQRQWDPAGKTSGLFHAVELGGEAGEALNVVKKMQREAWGMRGSRATVGDLAMELADVIIIADLLAWKFGIDLGAAVRAKFNASSEKLELDERL